MDDDSESYGTLCLVQRGRGELAKEQGDDDGPLSDGGTDQKITRRSTASVGHHGEKNSDARRSGDVEPCVCVPVYVWVVCVYSVLSVQLLALSRTCCPGSFALPLREVLSY